MGESGNAILVPEVEPEDPVEANTLYNFRRATMMIKTTLLVRLPRCKAIFGRKFSKSKNAYFWLSFSDPLETPLDGYP